jgi:hypothetical protein
MVANPGHEGESRANARSSSPALSAGGGSRACRLQRRSEAGEHRDQHAQTEENRQRNRCQRQRRCDAAKVSGAEVGSDNLNRDLRENESTGQSQRAADDADDRAFEHEQARQFTARHAENTQQSQLRAATHHSERLRRKDQQAAGEQRHQRQHVQIDTVRTGQAFAGGDARFRALDREAGGQLRLDAHAHGFDVDAGPKSQVDASNAAQPIEVRLGAGDIHHRESLLRIGGHQSCDAQGNNAQACLKG